MVTSKATTEPATRVLMVVVVKGKVMGVLGVAVLVVEDAVVVVKR